MWLSAGAIVVLAAVVAFSINALHDHADRARQVQLFAAHLGADAQQVSRIDGQATAEGRLSPQLSREFERLDRHLREGLAAYERAGGVPLRTQTSSYLEAVEKQLSLLARGRVAESSELDAREVDPSFDRLQHRSTSSCVTCSSACSPCRTAASTTTYTT